MQAHVILTPCKHMLYTAGQAGEGLTVTTTESVCTSQNISQRNMSVPGEDLRVIATEHGLVCADVCFPDLHADTAELPQARQGTEAAEKLPSSSTADTCQGLVSRAMEDSDGESVFGIAVSGADGSECEDLQILQ